MAGVHEDASDGAAPGADREAGPADALPLPNPDDAALRALLRDARTIAVLGMKDAEHEDAFRVPLYLQRQGYRIVPVNPKLGRVLGEPAAASLAEAGVPVDLVDVFRAPAHLPGHVDEILAMRPLPRAVWLQLGIRHDAGANRLQQAGIAVVQDLCLMVEHRRLLGGAAEPPAEPEP